MVGIIELKDVNRTYRMGSSEIFALKNVNLTLESGQIVVVLGPSGSGKTTLLNVIGGIDKCKGHISIDGKIITKMNKKDLTRYRRSTVGFIFQFFNLIPVFSAQENIEYAIELSHTSLSRREVVQKASKYLEAVELEKKALSFPSRLSGGEQQRVAAARAFAKEPRLLLCDEPTGELSVKEGKKVLSIIQQMVKDRSDLLVLLVTHNQEISKIAHKVIRLRSGEIDSITDQKPIDASQLNW
ncbi:ABC transporter ATP-binding protein [Candidatus Hodarchaeum mangrovi]